MPKQEAITELIINDVKYVREDTIKPAFERVVIQEGDSIATGILGCFCIVRSRNEGINAGKVVAADETGVQLENCRRIYYHRPLDKSLSWYEGVALSGLDPTSKVSGTVRFKTIIEDYSLTICTGKAEQSIMEFVPNAQT